MTDIVERLRERLLAPDADNILDEAADEIARLREAAEDALWHLGSDNDRAALHDAGKAWRTTDTAAVEKLRAALWENGND